MPKKVKMAIYARKTLLLLLKIEGGTLGLGKNEKSHSAEKVMKRGDPWTMPLLLRTFEIFLVHCETRTPMYPCILERGKFVLTTRPND